VVSRSAVVKVRATVSRTQNPAHLESLKEGRSERDRITYDSLWIHAKRHYDLAGIAGYWSARMDKELRKVLQR
jgi:hypothetical protein